MTHLRSAFSLLELLVATLISSFIGVVLMSALRQTGIIQRVVQNDAAYTLRIALAERQLRRDVEGMFVPVLAFPRAKKEANPVTTQNKSAQNQENGQQKKESMPEEQKKEQDKAPSLLKDFFLLTQKEEQFELCTFITSNPVAGYAEGPLAVLKPRVVRVVYQLKKDPNQKKSFILYRQEGKDLDFEKYTNAKEGLQRPYELISGIKSMKIECITYQQAKEEVTVHKKATWKRDLQAEFAEKQKKPDAIAAKASNAKKEQQKDEPLLPGALLITLTLWDNELVRESLYRFYIPIITVAEEPKAEKQAETASAQNQGLTEKITINQSIKPAVPQPLSVSLGIR